MKKHSSIQISLIFAIFSFLVTNNILGQGSDTLVNRLPGLEHMTIVIRQFDGKISKIYVSNSTGYYDEIKLDILKEKKQFDYLPILELIDKYNTEGWEIISSNMIHVGGPSDEFFYTYYFLKRQKTK